MNKAEHKQTDLRVLSLTSDSPSFKIIIYIYDDNFRLRNLSNDKLCKLWQRAARRGKLDLCKRIETLRTERLEREDRYYERNCN